MENPVFWFIFWHYNKILQADYFLREIGSLNSQHDARSWAALVRTHSEEHHSEEVAYRTGHMARQEARVSCYAWCLVIITYLSVLSRTNLLWTNSISASVGRVPSGLVSLPLDPFSYSFATSALTLVNSLWEHRSWGTHSWHMSKL